MTEKPKILVARIGAIGDICMLIPLVHALSRRYDVHWLIRHSHQAIVRCFPEVSCRLIGVSPAADEACPFPPELVERLQGEGYAALIDFSHWRSVAWLARRLPGVPLRALTEDPRQDALLGIGGDPADRRQAFNRIVPVPTDAPQVEKWRMLLRACGMEVELAWPLRPLALPPRDRPLRLFLHAHSGKPEKIWPAARFADVAKRLAASRAIRCVINGAGTRILRSLRWRLRFAGIRSEVAPLDPSFHRLRDELLRCDIALGCDSGPMHFASLLGTPTLVIYGPYPAREFAPLWRSVAVSPPRPGMAAGAVPAEAVSAALSRLIAGFPPASS